MGSVSLRLTDSGGRPRFCWSRPPKFDRPGGVRSSGGARVVVHDPALGLALLLGAAGSLTGCGGVEEADGDFVGVQFVGRALVAVAGLVVVLDEAAVDEQAVALVNGLGGVLGHGLPDGDGDGEVGGGSVGPLAVLLPPLGAGNAEVGDRGAGTGEAKLRAVDGVARRR